jgi:hypothetical protein
MIENRSVAPADAAARTNRMLALVMAVLGVLLVVSFFYSPLEVMVLIGGALLMLVGLGAIMIVFVKQLPAAATWLGASSVGLGALLFVHDLILPPPFNSITHGGVAVLVVVLAVAGLQRRIDFSAGFRRTRPSA